MKRTLHLDTEEINDLIEELNDYADTMQSRCQMFVQALADAGIKVAKANLGDYDGLVIFSKDIEPTEDGCTALMIATDKEKVIRSWFRGGEEVSAEVSPLLMAEFGSGWHSEVLFDIEGVGQGTFPGQKHAFDTNGWFWKDDDGKHHSYGEAPSYPMYKASLEMISQIQQIAEEIF